MAADYDNNDLINNNNNLNGSLNSKLSPPPKTIMVSEDFADEMYSKSYTPFHMKVVNPKLVKHYSRIQPENESQKRKIFMPMCGKSKDLKWLVDKGHTVVGVELSQCACRDIFVQDNIPYDVIDCPEVHGKLFQSKDGKLKAYNCDIFNFTCAVERGEKFTSVWERSAVIAFEEPLKERYLDHFKTLVEPGCLYMSSIIQYDKEEFYNHPYCVSTEGIKNAFESEFAIEALDETVYWAQAEYSKEQLRDPHYLFLKNTSGLSYLADRLYLYTKL